MWRNLVSLIIFCLLCTSCSRHPQLKLFGYIEGKYTYISSSNAGTLFDLPVIGGQLVKKGELLFTLDPLPEEAGMYAAKASMLQIFAQLKLAKIQFDRQTELYKVHATDKSSLDSATSTLESTTQQYFNAAQQLVQSTWSFQQKTIFSPITGLVFDIFYRAGEKVPANQPVLALLAPGNIKVLFYIPEPHLSQIHYGKTIHFGCDGCKTLTPATITFISPEAEYTPPVIYSKDTREKLVYLVRAEMPPETALQYHPGQPVDIIIDE